MDGWMDVIEMEVKYSLRMYTGFIWLMIGSKGGLVWDRS
jgi:hypothetical protein